jgi:hypothetical protein
LLRNPTNESSRPLLQSLLVHITGEREADGRPRGQSRVRKGEGFDGGDDWRAYRTEYATDIQESAQVSYQMAYLCVKLIILHDASRVVTI